MTYLLLALALAAPPDAGDPLPPGAALRLGTHPFRSDDRIRTLAVSPDGTRVAAPARDTVIVWDAATGREVCRCGPVADPVSWLGQTPFVYLDAAFSPDSRTLAAGTW